jgi:hypothetical protein
MARMIEFVEFIYQKKLTVTHPLVGKIHRETRTPSTAPPPDTIHTTPRRYAGTARGGANPRAEHTASTRSSPGPGRGHSGPWPTRRARRWLCHIRPPPGGGPVTAGRRGSRWRRRFSSATDDGCPAPGARAVACPDCDRSGLRPGPARSAYRAADATCSTNRVHDQDPRDGSRRPDRDDRCMVSPTVPAWPQAKEPAAAAAARRGGGGCSEQGGHLR